MGTITQKSNEWVLLVEDNPDHALLIRSALEAALDALRIELLTDGQAALDWIASPPEDHPATIFLDLQLPFASGTEVLRAIRAQSTLTEVPVVVLTTSHNPDDVRLCREYGASAYLTKDTGVDLLAQRGLDVGGYWPSPNQV